MKPHIPHENLRYTMMLITLAGIGLGIGFVAGNLASFLFSMNLVWQFTFSGPLLSLLVLGIYGLKEAPK